jgi:hypothetical protein
MVAPLIAAAGISAASSLLGGITGGKGAKKAAKIAAQSAAADRAQALQIYNTNMGLAQPGVDRGNAAGAQINALLGLGGNTAGANDALAAYKSSTGYAGRLAEGYGAINTGYAAKGALESGAAQKALLNYGQQQASGEFSNYLGQLSGQQNAGLNALGAATGAGNAYADRVSAANSSQGSAQAGAALYGAQAQQNALAGASNAFGQYFGQQDLNKRLQGYGIGMGGAYSTPGFGGGGGYTTDINSINVLSRSPFGR